MLTLVKVLLLHVLAQGEVKVEDPTAVDLLALFEALLVRFRAKWPGREYSERFCFTFAGVWLGFFEYTWVRGRMSVSYQVVIFVGVKVCCVWLLLTPMIW